MPSFLNKEKTINYGKLHIELNERMNYMNHLTFHNDVVIPQLGLGVYKVSNNEAIDVVSTALETGYRSIDTAQFYENERGVGEAIKKSDISREEIFITTKVWNSHHGFDKTLQAFEES